MGEEGSVRLAGLRRPGAGSNGRENAKGRLRAALNQGAEAGSICVRRMSSISVPGVRTGQGQARTGESLTTRKENPGPSVDKHSSNHRKVFGAIARPTHSNSRFRSVGL